MEVVARSTPEAVEEHMSRADWLADEEVAVTPRTPDPLEEDPRFMSGSEVVTDDDVVRSADAGELKRLWAEWVDRFGPEEASRRWLAIFAATDAPRTG